MTKSYYSEERSGLIQDKGFGLIHVCYGQGVGKTTRSVGLSIRAAGAGLKVVYVQFLKSGDSSETNIFAMIPDIEYKCPGEHPFILSKGPQAVHYRHAKAALGYAEQAVVSGAQVLVCDEILNTLVFEVLEKEQILGLMDRCRNRVELVMTGVDAPPEIIAASDYATRFVQEKHPYYAGNIARRGIEY